MAAALLGVTQGRKPKKQTFSEITCSCPFYIGMKTTSNIHLEPVAPQPDEPRISAAMQCEVHERRQFLRLLLCGSAALALGGGVVGALFWRQGGKAAAWKMAVTDRIDANFQILSKELQSIWLATDEELDRAFDGFARKIRTAGSAFSNEKITRKGIAGLIVDIARDRLDKGSRADAWFEKNLDPYLRPAFHDYASDLKTIESNFEQRFARHVADFNDRVVADLSAEEDYIGYVPQLEALEGSVEKAFNRQGVRFGVAAGLGIGLTLAGSGVYFYNQLMLLLVRRIKAALLRLVAPLARRLAIRLGRALLTVKFPPLSLVLGFVGLGLTTYEVVALRKRAQLDFEQSLDQGVAEMRKELDEQLKLPLSNNLAAFARNEVAIKSDITEGVLKG